MGVFTVDMPNDPGQLAKLCAAMAAENVNVILCAAAIGESGTVVFIADNEAAASGALESGDFAFAEHPSVTVRIANHPGEGAETFGKLAAAGSTWASFCRCGSPTTSSMPCSAWTMSTRPPRPSASRWSPSTQTDRSCGRVAGAEFRTSLASRARRCISSYACAGAHR